MPAYVACMIPVMMVPKILPCLSGLGSIGKESLFLSPLEIERVLRILDHDPVAPRFPLKQSSN